MSALLQVGVGVLSRHTSEELKMICWAEKAVSLLASISSIAKRAALKPISCAGISIEVMVVSNILPIS